MKLFITFGTACALALFSTASAQAATLASYPFTGSSLSSTDTDLSSAATDIALGAGLTDTTRFATGNGNPSPALRVNTDETATGTLASIAAGDYFTFTITPATGEMLTLNTLSVDLAVNSAAIVSDVAVQLSGTGATGSYVTLGSVSTFSTTTFTPESFDLSPANTALATGLPIYVRFVVSDNADNAAGYTGFDNIAVTGAVTALVPEPGTNALLAVGTLGLVGVVVRRRRATI